VIGLLLAVVFMFGGRLFFEWWDDLMRASG